MKTSTVVWIAVATAAVAYIAGAAYGPKTPGVKQIAQKLPGTSVL